MSVVAEPDIWEAIGFDPRLPCEHSQHFRHHVPDDPAKFLVRFTCTGCLTMSKYTLCLSGWNDLGERSPLACRFCETEYARRDQCLRILEVLY